MTTAAQLFATVHNRTHLASDLVRNMYVNPETKEERDVILRQDIPKLIGHLTGALAAAIALQRIAAGVEPPKEGD